MARPYQGWSVFYRAERRRWILSRGGRQKLLPTEVKNRREALRWATAWLVEQGFLEDDGTAKRRDATDTIAWLGRKWIAWRESLRGIQWESATVSNNRSHVNRQFIPGIGKLTVSEATPLALAAFIRGLGGAPNSKRNAYRSLVAMFDDAIDNKWIDLEFNPARAKTVQNAVPDAMTKAQEVLADTRFSLEQCQRLVSDPRVPFERRVKYVCALTMVARDGEVQGLSLGAIDFEAGTVRIYQTAKIRRYASDKSTGKPKTQKSRRLIPLHPVAKAALQDWIREVQVEGPDAPLFPGRDRDSYTRLRAAERLRKDLRMIGIRDSVNGVNYQFHHLRHTALNLLREAGVDSAVRDYLAGHSPKSVGEGTYQHRSIESMRPDVEKIALIWAGPEGSFSASSCARDTKTLQEDES